MSLIELQEQTGPCYINYFYEKLNCKGVLPTFTALTNTVTSDESDETQTCAYQREKKSTQ